MIYLTSNAVTTDDPSPEQPGRAFSAHTRGPIAIACVTAVAVCPHP